MSNVAVRELATVLEAAFRGDAEHSVLGSLWTVGDSEWSAKLADDGRSIREIARHAAVAKHAYLSSAFGDGSLSWDASEALAATRTSRDEVIAFLTEGHEALLQAVSELEDSDLEGPRSTHWGGFVPTRKILLTLIGHDYYHAGEMNHLRSVLQRNDRWNYWGEEMPAGETTTG